MASFLARVLGDLPLFRQAGAARNSPHSLTLVSAGSSLQGSIETPGALRVEGRLQGDVRVEGALEVLKEASIIGMEVRCGDLLIAGVIEADVFATGSVRISAGGCLRGNLHCHALQALPGAELQGQLTLGGLNGQEPDAGRLRSGRHGQAGVRVAAVSGSLA